MCFSPTFVDKHPPTDYPKGIQHEVVHHILWCFFNTRISRTTRRCFVRFSGIQFLLPQYSVAYSSDTSSLSNNEEMLADIVSVVKLKQLGKHPRKTLDESSQRIQLLWKGNERPYYHFHPLLFMKQDSQISLQLNIEKHWVSFCLFIRFI